MKKYNNLQRMIFTVIQENRCRGADEVVDNLDILLNAEEEFGIELFDFLIDLNNKQYKGD